AWRILISVVAGDDRVRNTGVGALVVVDSTTIIIIGLIFRDRGIGHMKVASLHVEDPTASIRHAEVTVISVKRGVKSPAIPADCDVVHEHAPPNPNVGDCPASPNARISSVGLGPVVTERRLVDPEIPGVVNGTAPAVSTVFGEVAA